MQSLAPELIIIYSLQVIIYFLFIQGLDMPTGITKS